MLSRVVIQHQLPVPCWCMQYYQGQAPASRHTMHPHKQVKQMEAEYTLGPFATTDQGPAETLNKSTIVRLRSMNCFVNISLLVKHLPVLSFPRVSNSTYTSSPSTAGLLRPQQFPCHILQLTCNSKSVRSIHMDAKSQLPQTEHVPLPSTLASEQNGRQSTQQQQNPTGASNSTRASTVIRSSRALSTRQP